MKNIYDITIGEIVNECKKQSKNRNYIDCKTCKFIKFCKNFEEHFNYIENIEVEE